jgi:hypothetical protein
MARLSPRWLLLPAALIAAAMPALLLRPTPKHSAAAPAQPPLAAPSEAPPLAAAFTRPLFAASAGDTTAAPDAPALVGVVGRLNQDAVALVRTADGNTRTLAPGESVDGWRLESLAADAGYFTRGNQRARVPMPGEDAPQ